MGLPGKQMGAGGALGFLSGGNTPQDWNQGIQNAPFTPHSTGPGVTPGQQTPSAGLNFNAPGQGESFYQQSQQAFGQPTQSAGYFQQAQQQSQNRAPLTNYSAQEYTNLQRPDLMNNAGLDPYYQNAAQSLTSNLNNQFGSRGMYGSSAAMNQIGDSLGDLFADQANREAQYALQRSGEQRAWEQLGGQLAGQADQQSRAGSQDALSWTMGLGNLAGNADQSNLAQLMGGMNAASTAQNLMRNRGQDYFNNMMQATMPLAGMAGATYDDMLGTDAQLMQNALMYQNGLAQAALEASLYNQQRQKSDAEWAKGMMGGGKGKGK